MPQQFESSHRALRATNLCVHAVSNAAGDKSSHACRFAAAWLPCQLGIATVRHTASDVHDQPGANQIIEFALQLCGCLGCWGVPRSDTPCRMHMTLPTLNSGGACLCDSMVNHPGRQPAAGGRKSQPRVHRIMQQGSNCVLGSQWRFPHDTNLEMRVADTGARVCLRRCPHDKALSTLMHCFVVMILQFTTVSLAAIPRRMHRISSDLRS